MPSLMTGVVFSRYMEEPILCSAGRSVETGDTLESKRNIGTEAKSVTSCNNASVTDIVSARDNQMAHDCKECARRAQLATLWIACRGLAPRPVAAPT